MVSFSNSMVGSKSKVFFIYEIEDFFSFRHISVMTRVMDDTRMERNSKMYSKHKPWRRINEKEILLDVMDALCVLLIRSCRTKKSILLL